MENYPKSLEHYQELMGELGDKIPQVMQAFGNLHQSAAADGVLDTKTKELIALAIGVTVRCHGCIAYHVNDAVQAGATREEIMETLGVAIMMGGGPSVIYSMEAMEALDQFMAEKK